MDRVDAVVVGAGVVGLAVARALAMAPASPSELGSPRPWRAARLGLEPPRRRAPPAASLNGGWWRRPPFGAQAGREDSRAAQI